VCERLESNAADSSPPCPSLSLSLIAFAYLPTYLTPPLRVRLAGAKGKHTFMSR
jgi:hypothetical protein